MEIARYLTLLTVMGLEAVFADGHKKHHEHLKIHVPEFIHHDFHTKVITIHHHHHKPKKEHHHHHHHHHHKPKPHVPHHVHKKKFVKTHVTTTKKTHGHKGHHGHHHHHKHHGHHHKHHGHHHKHHGHHHKYHGHHHKHHGHHHKHHDYDPYSYDPIPVPYDPSPDSYDPSSGSYDTSPASYDPSQGSYEDHFEPPYSPPSFESSIPEDPRVHGFTHTVKQLQVFDSHRDEGVPVSGGGYEVTEAGEDENDPLHSENSLQHSYPGTADFVKHLASEEPSHDPFASLTVPSTVPSEVIFQSSPQPANNFGIETFNTAGALSQHEAQQYTSAGPSQSAGLAQPSQEFSTGFEGEDDGGINDAETFSASGANDIPSAYYSNSDHKFSNESPTSFTRAAGIQ